LTCRLTGVTPPKDPYLSVASSSEPELEPELEPLVLVLLVLLVLMVLLDARRRQVARRA
jgi:hypothetical protein